MNLKIGEVYHGFLLKESEYIKEFKCSGYIFEHIQSGATLLKLQNDDDNKVFSISFRTPPCDNTGLTHIMEHSLLCGSRKYNTKEPFVELIKGSLNTFANAMTSPDFTIYPVASKNKKDFRNLMDVYLDSVFFPNIYSNDLIMKQEGWHYELNNIEDPLQISGVVYSEMKGAYSSDIRVIRRRVFESLLPDTIYRFDSGGNPEFIPELSEDTFLDYHRKFYHPQNSFIYLYGDGDILNELNHISDGYLNEFTKNSNNQTTINDYQKAFSQPAEKTITYPLVGSEDQVNKTFHTISWAIEEKNNPESYYLIQLLSYILINNHASPLKKALFDKGLGEELISISDNSKKNPIFGMILKNSNENQKSMFIKTVFETLQDIVDKGLDPDIIKGAVNRMLFEIREGEQSTPKGLDYNMLIMSSLVLDFGLFDLLKYEDLFKKLQEKLKNNYLGKFIDHQLLNNKHYLLLTAVPDKKLLQKQDEAFHKKLQEIKQRFSNEKLNNVMEETQKLIEYQRKEDTAEALEQIPLLEIDDIDKEIEKVEIDQFFIDTVPGAYYTGRTNGINYLSLLFRTDTVDVEDIPYINLLTRLLSKINTISHNYSQLLNQININTGGINFGNDMTISVKNEKDYTPYLLVGLKTLEENSQKSLEILYEIISQSVFNDKDRIVKLIKEFKSKMKRQIINSGHLYASRRALSYLFQSDKYNDVYSGLSYYFFLKEVADNIDNNFEFYKNKLETVMERIFQKGNLTFYFTVENNVKNEFTKLLKNTFNKLSNKKFETKKYNFDLSVENEGVITSSQVQYVSKIVDFRKSDYTFSGKFHVIENILRFTYLWNQIRVIGGAYGAMVKISRKGEILFVSYRDPRLKETLDVYNKVNNFLESFKINEREIRKIIIGAIRNFEPDLNVDMKGYIKFYNILQGKFDEDLQREKDEIFNFSLEDLRAYAKIIGQQGTNTAICVVGSENELKKNAPLFNKLIYLD